MSVQGPKIVLTDAARALLEQIKSARRQELALVIGNGCCDSTAPFLFAGHLPGPNERLLALVAGIPVYLDESIAGPFEAAEVVIDVREDPQPDSFSCEAELGKRFWLQRLPAAQAGS